MMILFNDYCSQGAGALFGAERADVLSGTAEPGVAAGDFFGQPMYLTVSGQMEAEMFACALGKVYTFGPTFRAEKSNTSRHLAEFVSRVFSSII